MENKTNLAGFFYVLGYCVLGSAIDVFLSSLLQSINLFVLIFWTFAFTWLGFILISAVFFQINFKKLIKSYQLILLLNIATLGSWLGLFLGLKWTEPSILVAILFGLGPIISVFVETYKKNPVGKKNIFISLLLFLIVIMLIVLAVDGQRNVTFSSNLSFVIALSVTCILTALSMSLGTYISKYLSKQGINAVNIQAFRFPLLLVVCYFLLPNAGLLETLPSNFWLYLPVIVILGNMIPLWMLQKGIEKSSVLTISIIINISPCITFALELLDPSLNFSHYKLAVLVILFLVMLMANNNILNYIHSLIFRPKQKHK